MRILRARYRSATDFLEHYDSSLVDGGVFFPTRDRLDLGTPVLVEIAFPALTERHFLRAVVVYRRPGRLRPERQRAGLGLEFLAMEQRKRDFLLAAARGLSPPEARRRFRRLPMQLPVGWFLPGNGGRLDATTRDIGAGGAFLVTEEQLPLGAPVVIEVTTPGCLRPLPVEGRVVWSCQAAGERGLGVQFRCRDTGGIHRLKELVRRLEDRA